MDSVLDKIKAIREENKVSVCDGICNPYTVAVLESTGALTYYCFSMPIRNSLGKLLDPKWKKEGDAYNFLGTVGEFFLSGNDLTLKNSLGSCIFGLPDKYESGEPPCIKRNYSELYPSPNGVTIRTLLGHGREYHLTVTDPLSRFRIQKSDKALTLITESGTPFASVSGIFAATWDDIARSPIDITGKRINKKQYSLVIKPKGPTGRKMYIEIKMHNPTLFSDSTVESLHPGLNNALGSAAFLGMTLPLGTQWLYSEFSSSLLTEIKDIPFKKAILHIPCYSNTRTILTAFLAPDAHGATSVNWTTRPILGSALGETVLHNKYQDLDVTEWILNENTNTLKDSCQMVLKAQKEGRRFAAVSTADCSYAPQILELKV